MQIAVLVLGAAVLFFLLSDPPVSVCKVQVETFKERQLGNSFPDAKKSKAVPDVQSTQKFCKVANSMGGCLNYFEALKMMIRDFRGVSTECYADLMAVKEIREAHLQAILLMSQIAWGEAPPDYGVGKYGWLESPEIKLFCELKQNIERHMPESVALAVRKQLFEKLPEAQTLPPEDAWSRMIFSAQCELLPY